MIVKTPDRQQLIVFIGITFILSFSLQSFIINKVGTVHTFWSYGLLWIPGAVALSCALFFKNTKNPEKTDLALWMPNNKYFAIAYLVPAGAAILILVISILIGIGEFHFEWDKSTMNRFLFAPTLGVLVAVVTAAGHELGWRGFMHTRLQGMRIAYPYVFTGIVWAVWHWPLILFSDYTPSRLPAVSLVLFTIMIVSFSVFLGQLRHSSRSVWPCVLALAAHTTWIQGIYPHFLKAGALDPFFGGQAGVILAILYLSMAIALQSRPIE